MENIPVFPSFDARIKAQAELWRRRSSEPEEKKQSNSFPFITISRQFGCPAYPLAKRLSEKLKETHQEDYIIYDRKLIEWVCHETHVSENLLSSLTKKTRGEVEDWIVGLFSGEASEISAFKKLAIAVKVIASRGYAILIGRGSSIITSDMKNGLHIRLIAPIEWRIDYFRKNYPEKLELANEAAFRKIDRDREGFVQKYLSADLNNPDNYHLIINTSQLDIEKGVELIMTLL